MESVWQKKSSPTSFNSLDKDIQADVVIIGGGITGILTAYQLHQKGICYVLLEKERILQGVTPFTTAKITSQHSFIYQKLVKEFSVEDARLYYKANQNAIKSYKVLSKLYPCDFRETDNYVYSLNNKTELDNEITALISADIPFVAEYELELPFRTDGAVKFTNQAQFNPLMLLYALSKELNIFENTFVSEVRDNIVFTEKYKVKAEKIIVTTHFPFINTHGLYPLKLYQERSYVIALENAQKLKGMYIDGSGKGFSFRNYDKYLLLGGGAHRTGKEGCGYFELRSFASRHYPDAKEICNWATQDCMTLDSLAYIGQYSKNTPDILVATGFNKWGMTTSMVASEILSDLVCEKENELSQLFNPSRNMLRPQLFVNSIEAITNLLNPVGKRCTHLGCALKWNKYEHTYDCVCHGSRFDKKGRVIDNPAQKDLKL